MAFCRAKLGGLKLDLGREEEGGKWLKGMGGQGEGDSGGVREEKRRDEEALFQVARGGLTANPKSFVAKSGF